MGTLLDSSFLLSIWTSSTEPVHIETVTDRLRMFREYMAQFDAAADPFGAVERGQYVASAQAIADRVCPLIELEPYSCHLLTGGIGSGKTTQLLMMRGALSRLPDTTAIFVDITKKHELDQLRPGILLLIAAIEMSGLLPADTGADVKKLRPPAAARDLALHTQDRLESLVQLKAALSPAYPHVVFLFDGLDRMRDMSVFRDIVSEDIRALRGIGIGAVLVGPIDTIYAKEKPIRDMFDAHWHLSPVDISRSEGMDFLVNILRRRAPKSILPDEACQKIAHYSGGVLRDMVQLARRAGYEAYAAGAEQISAEHVELAADVQGRMMLQAVGQDGIRVLERVRRHGKFVPTSDRELALLASRNVLEYQDGAKIRYAVHPTIEALLESIATP